MSIIRKAKLEDVKGIANIDTLGEILKTCSPLDRLDPKNKSDNTYYKKFIKGKDKWCYIAEKNNKIIAYILFEIKKRESFWNVKKVGYLDALVVEKNERNKGIATLLIDKAKEIFKKRKIKYITISVQTDNKLAHKIWKKLGFKEHRVDMYLAKIP